MDLKTQNSFWETALIKRIELLDTFTKMCVGIVNMLHSEPAGHIFEKSTVAATNASNMSLAENHAENLVSVQDIK